MSLENENISFQPPGFAQPSTVGRFSLDNLPKYLPVDIHFIILALWPALLMFIRGGWGFSPAATIDPWIYLGYMLDLPVHEKIFPGAYYGTRLPLLLPGYGLYQLFTPVVANYILHLGIYYIGMFSLYIILKNIFNRRTALLTSLLLGAYGWYLVSTSWDYVDGIGIAYMLLTILLLLYAAKDKRWPLTMFVAGASSIAFFTTNLFLLSFTPFLTAFYLFANWKYRKNNLFVSLVLYALGGIAAVILFGLAYQSMTGRFFYFADSFNMIASSISTASPYNTADFSWYRWATWLVFPVCTALITIVWIAIKPRKILTSSWLNFFRISYLVVFLYFLIWQVSGHSPILAISYYASYMTPPVFLLIGTISAEPLLRLSKRQFLWVGCSAFLFMGLSHYTFPSSYVTSANYSGILLVFLKAIPTISIIIPISFILGAFLILLVKPKLPRLISFAFLCFSLCNALTTWGGQSSVNGDMFSLVVKSTQAIRTITPEQDGYFWYNYRSTDGGVYTAIASTNLWGYRLINYNFPSTTNLSGTERANFTIGKKLILLSTDAEVLDQAKSALKTIGLDATFVAQKQITENNVSFFIVFATITERTNIPASF